MQSGLISDFFYIYGTNILQGRMFGPKCTFLCHSIFAHQKSDYLSTIAFLSALSTVHSPLIFHQQCKNILFDYIPFHLFIS